MLRLFTELRTERTRRNIQGIHTDKFDNKIVINAKVLLNSYKQQKLYLCKQNLIKYFILHSLIFFLTLAKI